MAKKVHTLITLSRSLFVLMLCAIALTLFMYSPFYAKSALWLLNKLTDVRVDPVAAESQKTGQLSLESTYEPGSPEWVARQAYLAEVNKALNDGQVDDFSYLQHRYDLLQQMIKQQKAKEQSNTLEQASESDIEQAASVDYFQQLIPDENEPLFQQYREFLVKNQQGNSKKYPHKKQSRPKESVPSPFILQRPDHQPHAIVILGGGLMAGKQKGQIILNPYTQKRLQTAIEIYNKYHLPILLSGVESPYMQKWLKQHDIEAQFLENRSMNTCENTRFSALLLQKQGGAPTVFLVTDAYHMPRSRQLFAQNGIETIPVVASLPNALTEWQPSRQNWMHSRRANYELLALIRSKWIGESNCREVP
ncbi:YdcF family protein [Acinetobacter qingfengensis]|uniref:DUF218 domain-containing protein n=1 Tax=Acinetobacter qingfengensis TaxID=1262585 RepID=A0A1E7RDY7_9GAMM|nr:YdcF family protein [Acinetobacter qingfengensis]KAA8735329.1 YdcF family protein [Acinetobacter qingfengensis]OEY97447.1 hypothetical protein BJI46_10110 [Acinetobacter qingfengensis]